ncbi:MAG: glucose 1-dehydrogenase [Deltaproteobacteria bacterium]|nr:glucose 1-dehydrogenase [Deltaproteobacteria bacterium]MBZ0220182.1 glucose 1-dehydrogenase [Deltaproteobacteria bacterium]
MAGLFDLAGKAAIVTGGARGLGRAMALGLAGAGADIAVSDIIDVSEAVVGVRALGRRAVGVKADVGDEESVRELVEKTIAELGRIDILVNNAGIFRISAAENIRAEDWDAVLDINLRGQLLCAKEAGRHMIRQRSGKIINIASVAGLAAFPESAAYNASKAGVILLTKTLAAEWGKHNIQVNAVCPGLFETDMTRDLIGDSSFMAFIRERVPLGRGARPEELAGTAVFLASKASDYVTGHALVIDGGWTAML